MLSFNISSFIKRETLLIIWHFMYAHLNILRGIEIIPYDNSNYIIIAHKMKYDKQIKALSFKDSSVIIIFICLFVCLLCVHVLISSVWFVRCIIAQHNNSCTISWMMILVNTFMQYLSNGIKTSFHTNIIFNL